MWRQSGEEHKEDNTSGSRRSSFFSRFRLSSKPKNQPKPQSKPPPPRQTPAQTQSQPTPKPTPKPETKPETKPKTETTQSSGTTPTQTIEAKPSIEIENETKTEESNTAPPSQVTPLATVTETVSVNATNPETSTVAADASNQSNKKVKAAVKSDTTDTYRASYRDASPFVFNDSNLFDDAPPATESYRVQSEPAMPITAWMTKRSNTKKRSAQMTTMRRFSEATIHQKTKFNISRFFTEDLWAPPSEEEKSGNDTHRSHHRESEAVVSPPNDDSGSSEVVSFLTLNENKHPFNLELGRDQFSGAMVNTPGEWMQMHQRSFQSLLMVELLSDSFGGCDVMNAFTQQIVDSLQSPNRVRIVLSRVNVSHLERVALRSAILLQQKESMYSGPIEPTSVNYDSFLPGLRHFYGYCSPMPNYIFFRSGEIVAQCRGALPYKLQQLARRYSTIDWCADRSERVIPTVMKFESIFADRPQRGVKYGPKAMEKDLESKMEERSENEMNVGNVMLPIMATHDIESESVELSNQMLIEPNETENIKQLLRSNLSSSSNFRPWV